MSISEARLELRRAAEAGGFGLWLPALEVRIAAGLQRGSREVIEPVKEVLSLLMEDGEVAAVDLLPDGSASRWGGSTAEQMQRLEIAWNRFGWPTLGDICWFVGSRNLRRSWEWNEYKKPMNPIDSEYFLDAWTRTISDGETPLGQIQSRIRESLPLDIPEDQIRYHTLVLVRELLSRGTVAAVDVLSTGRAIPRMGTIDEQIALIDEVWRRSESIDAAFSVWFVEREAIGAHGDGDN
jgi:hypothetical protein